MHHTPAIPSRSIDAAIARSWLLVNGTRTDLFDRADQSGADQIILDIEDAVDPKLKPSARRDVETWLQNKSAWVRINDRSTPFWSDDVDLINGLPGLVGVMLANTESAEHATETFDRLGGTTPVPALIESVLRIEEAPTIARARGVLRLAFGSGDYRRDTGASADDRDGLSAVPARGRQPHRRSPWSDRRTHSQRNSHRVLRDQSAVTVSLGLTGILCLDTEQAPVINEVLSPTPSDAPWALNFLADFEARGCVVRDGSDLPRLGRAQKIARLAAAFGSSPNKG
jgi:citrate lyase subunit beta / citryl-CoA lyase